MQPSELALWRSAARILGSAFAPRSVRTAAVNRCKLEQG